jgi:hypothetical protein
LGKKLIQDAISVHQDSSDAVVALMAVPLEHEKGSPEYKTEQARLKMLYGGLGFESSSVKEDIMLYL